MDHTPLSDEPPRLPSASRRWRPRAGRGHGPSRTSCPFFGLVPRFVVGASARTAGATSVRSGSWTDLKCQARPFRRTSSRAAQTAVSWSLTWAIGYRPRSAGPRGPRARGAARSRTPWSRPWGRTASAPLLSGRRGAARTVARRLSPALLGAPAADPAVRRPSPVARPYGALTACSTPSSRRARRPERRRRGPGARVGADRAEGAAMSAAARRLRGPEAARRRDRRRTRRRSTPSSGPWPARTG